MTLPKTLKYGTALLLTTGIVFIALADNAHARDREKVRNFATQNGRTGAVERSVTSDENGRTVTKTYTDENGETHSQSRTLQGDAETGAYTRSTTGVNGNTRTYTGIHQDGQTSGTYTTQDGDTGTYSRSTVQNEDGSVTRGTSYVAPDGSVRSRSSELVFDPETNTYVRTTTGTEGNTYSVEKSYDAETGAYTKSVTGPEGETHTGTVTITK